MGEALKECLRLLVYGGCITSVIISVRIPKRLRGEMERLKQGIGVLEGNLAAEFMIEDRDSH